MKLFKFIDKYDLKLKSYDEIIKNAKAIRFNDEFIEVVGSVIFLKKDTNVNFNKFLNVNLVDVELETEEFEELLKKLKTHDENILFIDSGIIPISTVRLNVSKLIDNSLSIMIYEDALYFNNNIVITTDVAEFRGSGIFSTKDLVLKVNEVTFEDLNKRIKE